MSTNDRNNTEQEIRLLQKFRHPFIVAYKDSFLDRDQYLNIVMTYCDNGDMYSRIKQVKGELFSEAQICHWLVQMALALYYMHEKRILHRDLKTQNVFLKNGKVKLGDFGIAKVLDDTRDFANTCIGTPYYMSPELFKNKPYSYKSDIWAFGCVLYEMCNLRTAFEAQSLNGLAMKILKGNYAPIHKAFSRDLRDLVGSMLNLNAGKRPNIIDILKKPFLQQYIVLNVVDVLQHTEFDEDNYIEILNIQSDKLGLGLDVQMKTKEYKDHKDKDKDKDHSHSGGTHDSLLEQDALKRDISSSNSRSRNTASRGKPKENLDNNIRERLLKEKELLRKAKADRQKIQEKMNKLEYEKSYRMNIIKEKRIKRFEEGKYLNESERQLHDKLKHSKKKSRPKEGSRDASNGPNYSVNAEDEHNLSDFKKKRKQLLKDEQQKEYESELQKIRYDNLQNRKDAISKEKAIFRPSTGFKIDEGHNPPNYNEVTVKKLQEDYDFDEDPNNSDTELEVIYEENEEEIVEDATSEDKDFFVDYAMKTVEYKGELKKSVLKVSNLKHTLKNTIKDSVVSLNMSTLERDCDDSYNYIPPHQANSFVKSSGDTREDYNSREDGQDPDQHDYDEHSNSDSSAEIQGLEEDLEESLEGRKEEELVEQKVICMGDQNVYERCRLLRTKIENLVGNSLFEKVYGYIKASKSSLQDRLEQKTQIENMLGRDNLALWLLFDQLLFIEEQTGYLIL